MDRIPVPSSYLKSVGHDPVTKILEIEFQDGSIYHYFSVSKIIYDGLMQAASHGQFLDIHLKQGGYHYLQIR